MTDENYRRKLTASLSADVTDHSRLMDDDEAATVSTLKSHRNLIAKKVLRFNKLGIDTLDDNIISAFRSIEDAASSALAIQEVLRE